MKKNNLKQTLLFLALLTVPAMSGKLEVTADIFSSKEDEGKAYFSGNALAKKDGSQIKSNQIIVSFDKNKTIVGYESDGNTTFVIKKGKLHFEGSCNSVGYHPLKDTYTLDGDVVVKDVVNNRTLYGESILIDNNKTYFRVEGKPTRQAKIVFEVN